MSRLTDKLITMQPLPLHGSIRLTDSEMPGFCCTFTSNGVITFGLRYRVSGNRSMVKIGRFPTWKTTAARERAKELQRLVDRGIDPRAQEPKQQEPADTVASVISQFIARDQKPRNRRWQEVERILQRELAPLLERPIQSITKRDILDVLDTITDRGAAVRANRVLTWTKHLFAWAIDRDIIAASPAATVKRPTSEVARDRVLTPDELAAVWRATKALQPPFREIVQMLVLTGCRRGEVVEMRWPHIDLGQRLWTIPREFTKADRAHEVPLSDLALEILERAPRSEGLVFSSQSNPDRTVASFQKTKAKLDRLSGVSAWRLHDLRRTAASGMAKLGHAPHVVSAILNHAPASVQGITAVYNKHRYADEKRAALDAWSREIARLIGRGESKVVRLPRTA